MSYSEKEMLRFSKRVDNVIDSLNLPKTANKELLKLRFLDEVEFYEKKRDHTKKFYNTFRFLVTTGSILLPAILSIGQMDPNKLPANFDQITYWSSWSISLVVTVSNGFLQLFSLDKNYFNYSLTVEQLKTEGWQFFGLSGKYEDYKEHNMESYKMFCKNIENIKRKQIENEFNGKADSKKKQFDFAGELLKFKEDIQKSSNLNRDKDEDNLPKQEPPPLSSSKPPPIPERDIDNNENSDTNVNEGTKVNTDTKVNADTKIDIEITEIRDSNDDVL